MSGDGCPDGVALGRVGSTAGCAGSLVALDRLGGRIVLAGLPALAGLLTCGWRLLGLRDLLRPVALGHTLRREAHFERFFDRVCGRTGFCRYPRLLSNT